MTDRSNPDVPYALLDPSEEIDVHARSEDAIVLVTSRRLAVATASDRFDLDIPYERLRRIQFDIERTRPATLVIVPEHPADRPVVLAIPPEQYEAVAQAIAIAGRRLYDVENGQGHVKG